MIKDNQALFNRLHVLLDAFVIAGAYWLAWFFKFESGLISYSIGLPTRYYFRALYYIIPVYLYHKGQQRGGHNDHSGALYDRPASFLPFHDMDLLGLQHNP